MKKSYESELPCDYYEIKVVDAGNTKFSVLMNVVAVFTIAAIVATATILIKPAESFVESYNVLRNIILILAMLLYIILHELVHGIAYKLTTRHKLTFGLTLTVAYCGVPEIYVYRKTALISLLAPFLLFLPVFGMPIFLLENAWDKIYAAFLLGLHIGGCTGDLYDTYLYLFKFRSPDTLMRDTGPKQTFYIKQPTSPQKPD